MKPEIMDASVLRDQADELLRRLSAGSAALTSLQNQHAEAVRIASLEFEGEITNLQTALTTTEAELRKLALDHLDNFFPEIQEDRFGNNLRRDLATLPSGTIQLKITTRVKQTRSVLKKLLEMGQAAEDFVKRAVSVNWDALTSLSDAELGGLGTERITETDIAYQLPGNEAVRPPLKTAAKSKKKTGKTTQTN